MKPSALLKNAVKWVYDGMEHVGDAELRFWTQPVHKPNIHWVSVGRSFAKACTYRFFGTLASFAIVYILTKKGSIASIAAGLDIVVKICIYYVHERIWNRVKWGRND